MTQARDNRTRILPGDRWNTQLLIMQQLYGGRVPRARMLVMSAFALTCVGIYAACRFFSNQAGAVSVFFAVLGILPTVDVLIERNKMKARMVTPENVAKVGVQADARLTGSVLVLFLAVMFAYGAAALLVPMGRLVTSFRSQLGPWLAATEPSYELSGLTPILLNNLGVCLGVLLLSMLYRTGGALLVLAWNASVWGTVFAYFARIQEGTGLTAVTSFGKTMACILPHITLEALGYILMALSGIAITRGLARVAAVKTGGKRLATSIGILCTGGILAIVVAAVLEVTLAPKLLSIVGESG